MLASDVYNNDIAPAEQLKGWTRFYCPSEPYPSGYFGAAYVDSVAKPSKAIVAHRGTKSVQDLVEDISILADMPFEQLNDAVDFSREVRDILPAGIEISHTGHSLGAVIAEIMSMSLLFSLESITFENPGSLEIFGKWNKKINLDPKIPIKTCSTIIQSRVNMINTCNTQAGSVYYLKDKKLGLGAHWGRHPESYLENPFYMTANTLEQHPIAGMLAYLESGGIIAAVEDWPAGFEAGYKMFLADLNTGQSEAECP